MASIFRRKRTTVGMLYRHFLSLMLVGSAFASVLLFVRFVATGSQWLVFLLWNLFLAWVPALTALWFTRVRRKAPRILTVLLFFVWLAFLPNTFYIVSDFIHLSAKGDISILFDAVLLFVFSSVGFLLGLGSLGVMHLWLRRYMAGWIADLGVGLIIFLCSFAIYLGRYLRWNSWDVIRSPFGLLVDVSDRIVNPLDHPRMASTMLLFFVLIAVSYSAVWYSARYLYRRAHRIFSAS